MRKYEGLFILNTAGKEEGVQEIVDRIRGELSAAGAKVESVQKMDKKPFARATNRRVSAGFYVNILFSAEPELIPQLPAHFEHDDDVYRFLVTRPGPAANEAATGAPAPVEA